MYLKQGVTEDEASVSIPRRSGTLGTSVCLSCPDILTDNAGDENNYSDNVVYIIQKFNCA